MTVISLTEFERLSINASDPDAKSISLENAKALSGLRLVSGERLFKFVSRDTVSAQQFVGVAQIGRLSVEVLPKVEGVEGGTMRRNLIAMLSVAFDLHISVGDAASVEVQRYGILEALVGLFCGKLFAQIQRGLVHRYENRQENLTFQRGRLDTTAQVRLNAANPERLFCRFDEYIADTALNQVLKAAVRLLLGVSRNLNNQKRLAEILMVFSEVSDVLPAHIVWGNVVFDRLNSRYLECYKFAELFLRRLFPDLSAGSTGSYSLFFDMNKLFEKYVGKVLQRICHTTNLRVHLQGPRRYLAFDESAEQRVFAMLPDVTISDGNGVSYILDTKWKMLSTEESREGVIQADMYQMFAYVSQYKCSAALLVYPHHSGLMGSAGDRASYLVSRGATEDGGNDMKDSRIRIVTVDLSSIETVPKQLSDALSRASRISRNEE